VTSRPTKDDLEAARDRVLPDLLGPGLRIVFCGINPGLWSAATGHHFARPGNRFWPALHAAGLTPRRLDPAEQAELLPLGLGLTNVVPRASARADELTRQEYVDGGAALRTKVEQHTPAWLAVLGVTAYRAAFGDRTAQVGEQPRTWGPTRLWVLPNPSGLNAHWSAAALADEFRRLGEAAGVVRPDRAGDVGSATASDS
jgi:TDG/mug DNA glycosylase family protein